jgi:restriction system protein
MTINEAILQVMHEAGRPLSPTEAYDAIMVAGLYTFHAQKPENVVKSQIRRHCKGLDFPSAEPTKYFGITDDGKFFPLSSVIRGPRQPRQKKESEPIHTDKATLAGTVKDLKRLHLVHRELLKLRIIADLKKLPPVAFETFAKRLLDIYGFQETKVTALSNDGGIDGYGKLKVGLAHMNVAFQCKRWTTGNVGRPEIDKFRGAIQGEYEQGLFFTTAGFATGAQEVSIKPGAVPVILIDGPSIADLMIDKGFGVETEIMPLFTYSLDAILEQENGT